MRQEKFTPGEWHIEDFNEWGIAGKFVVDKDKEPIAKVCNRYDKIPDLGGICLLKENMESVQANAHLIAVAPKMYERLKGVRCFLWSCLQYMPYTDSLYEQIEYQVKRIDEVLKEAKGEE